MEGEGRNPTLPIWSVGRIEDVASSDPEPLGRNPTLPIWSEDQANHRMERQVRVAIPPYPFGQLFATSHNPTLPIIR